MAITVAEEERLKRIADKEALGIPLSDSDFETVDLYDEDTDEADEETDEWNQQPTEAQSSNYQTSEGLDSGPPGLIESLIIAHIAKIYNPAMFQVIYPIIIIVFIFV